MSTIQSKSLPSVEAHRFEFADLFTSIRSQAPIRDRERALPYDDVAELTRRGFGALRVPKKFGGGGLSLTEFTEVLLDLAAADSNFPQIFRAHFLFVEAILLEPPAPARDLWLKRIGDGTMIGGAHTERNAGNSNHFETRIERDADNGIFLSGQKFYSTGSLYADWVVTVAEDRDDKLRAVAVPRTAQGLELRDDWHGFGQRLTASGTTVFDRVAIDESHILPEFGTLGAYGTSLAQVFHLIGLAGIARSAHRDVIDYVRERKRYFAHGGGALPKDDAIVQEVVGELSSAVYVSAIAVRDAAAKLDTLFTLLADGEADTQTIDETEADIFRAQYAVITAVLAATTRLFDVGGASALYADKNWDRYWRNARTLSSHNPVGFRLKAIGDYELNRKTALRAWYSGVDLASRFAAPSPQAGPSPEAGGAAQ
jgi:alkylation response protein AidB-like acyl-CoA dehydrogenase